MYDNDHSDRARFHPVQTSSLGKRDTKRQSLKRDLANERHGLPAAPGSQLYRAHKVKTDMELEEEAPVPASAHLPPAWSMQRPPSPPQPIEGEETAT
jgi:hypothetical protein